jgi:7-keto-8-aminopelargonate synthetase-like enzyme
MSMHKVYFNKGYIEMRAHILSTIDTLVSKNDVIVYDVDSHACIVDGVRLHVGKRFTFRASTALDKASKTGYNKTIFSATLV